MKPAALLLLIFLAACATPPPASNGGAVMDGLQAAATQTTIAATQQAAPIETAAAIATAATMADNATRQAGIVATQTASPIQTQQAQAIIVTQQAQATAASHAQSLEAIAINAAEMQQQAQTRATVAALNLDIANAQKNADRWEWVKDIGAGIFLFVLLGGSVVIGKIQLFKHRSIFTANGDPVVINGDWLADDEPEPSPPLMIASRTMPFTPRNGQTQPIEMAGESFPLTQPNGRAIIYTFTHHDLHALRLNVERGDLGFRRKETKPGAGLGLQEMIELTDRTKYTSILSAMKANGWVESAGNASQWTSNGLRDVLGVEPLPQQNTAL